MRAVIPHADERLEPLVPRGHAAKAIEIFVFRFGRRQLQRFLETDRGWERRVDERIERARADDAQHRGLLLLVWSDVPLSEGVWRIYGHVVRGLLHEFRVLLIIEQIRDLARIAELDLEQPRTVRVCVDQLRLRTEVAVHRNHLARCRAVEL